MLSGTLTVLSAPEKAVIVALELTSSYSQPVGLALVKANAQVVNMLKSIITAKNSDKTFFPITFVSLSLNNIN